MYLEQIYTRFANKTTIKVKKVLPMEHIGNLMVQMQSTVGKFTLRQYSSDGSHFKNTFIIRCNSDAAYISQWQCYSRPTRFDPTARHTLQCRRERNVLAPNKYAHLAFQQI
jgi:hypothetical protein